jgi:hypothetical protein
MNPRDPVRAGENIAALHPAGAVRSADPVLGLHVDGHGHAVSWAAILAGAAASAALSLILLVLGMGLGLSSISPWSAQGASATTIGTSTIVWILLVALVASGTGGYLAGRLRTKWVAVHTDEVYFRDTAHGFLAWSVATLITAAALTSAVGAIVGTGLGAAGTTAGLAGTAAAGATGNAGGGLMSDRPSAGDGALPGASGLSYYTDSLFRASAAPGAAASAPSSGAIPSAAAQTQISRIFVRSFENQGMAPGDTQYVGQLIVQRTGMSQVDAEKLVTDTYAKASTAAQEAQAEAKEAANRVRKAAAYTALWVFVSLLLGAFSASLLATYGGRRRDL